jgi:stage V sporulation protein R
MAKAKRKTAPKTKHLYTGKDWDFDILNRCLSAIEEIGVDEMGLDVYPNQIEVITAEQMLDAYSSAGLPLMYKHWSFGKSFVRNEAMYRKGYTGLAYEIVINADPCISYIMEENSATMQTMVMAHAAFGHNHFFKNNHLFQQWTDASSILNYMQFARDYITQCEERHGVEAVEATLDAAHAIRDNGVDRYTRQPALTKTDLKAKDAARRDHAEANYNDLWRTLPPLDEVETPEKEEAQRKAVLATRLGLPESNLLYFLEKQSPVLDHWQRELLRIIRTIAQYFYPQKQTKVMNEGCACFCHYEIMNRLYDKGLITEGAMLEFIDFHARVIAQPPFDSKGYGGINPYALGFAMMQDIKKICEEPTDEDREWFPDIAGCNRTMEVLKDAWRDYRDESFILQFLSPRLIRDFRLFMVHDDSNDDNLLVDAIHNGRSYRSIRQALAKSYTVNAMDLDIQVVGAAMDDDRTLTLKHIMHDRVPVEGPEAHAVLEQVRRLWGFDIVMLTEEAESGKILDGVKCTDEGTASLEMDGDEEAQALCLV